MPKRTATPHDLRPPQLRALLDIATGYTGGADRTAR
jgi:hypothetical protein